MLILAESSKQRAIRAAGESAAETMRPALRLENWRGRMFTADSLSISIIHDPQPAGVNLRLCRNVD
jgi:hypothetical protein